MAGAAPRPLWLGMEEPMALGASPAVNLALSTRIKSAGARYQRIAISWRSLAPTRPANPADLTSPGPTNATGIGAYRNSAVSSVDDVLRAAADKRPSTGAGLEPLLVVEDAPDWAQNPGRPKCPTSKTDPNREFCRFPGTWSPKPDELAKFVQALATRYDGSGRFNLWDRLLPKVTWFQAWNEPNLSTHLTPQRRGRSLVGPGIYRGILSAFRKGLADAGRTDAKVVAAGMAPFGNPVGVREGTSPQRFARAVLCLRYVKARRGGKVLAKLPRCAPASFDVWSQHPYDLVGSPDREVDYDLQNGLLPDLPGFRAMLNTATKLGTVTPSGRKPLWITEFDWWTNPPNRILGKSQRTVATWTTDSLFRAWRAGVDTLFWFRTRDVPGWPGGLWLASDYVANPRTWGPRTYLTPGRLTPADIAADRPKPALTSFTWPFRTVTGPRPWAWGIVPCRSSGVSVAVQRQVARRWVNAAKGVSSASGVFTAALPRSARGVGIWRAVVTSAPAACGGASPTWTAKR
ncbi:MAG: hypothetical protein WCO96_01560 [Actinomycetes bacterium]